MVVEAKFEEPVKARITTSRSFVWLKEDLSRESCLRDLATHQLNFQIFWKVDSGKRRRLFGQSQLFGSIQLKH
jgi:hypothetical protein